MRWKLGIGPVKELETKPMLRRAESEAKDSTSMSPERPKFLSLRLETKPLAQMMPIHCELGAQGSVPGFHESREEELAKDCLSLRRAADSEMEKVG